MTKEEAIKKAVQFSNFLQLHPEWNNNKEVVLAAVQKSGWALEHASDEFRKDKEVILSAIANDRWSIRYSLLKGYQDFDEIVEKEGENFLFSCWDNLDEFVRIHVANHPDFLPNLEQIKIRLEDCSEEVQQVYQLRQDEWLSKMEENKLRNNI